MTIVRIVFLWPFSLLFYFVVAVKNFLFDHGFFQAQKFPVKVISIGNLSMGGTGKTPLSALIVEKLLANPRLKVGIVSRGYKGSYTGLSEKVDIHKSDAAAYYGDEPTWFAGELGVPVFVGRSRCHAVAHALRDASFDIIVADDAFQHRWLSRDVDIVLVDVTEKNSFPVPIGRFREPLRSLRRAHYVIVTKSNLVSLENRNYWLQRIEKKGFSLEKKNLLFLNYKLDFPYLLSDPQQQVPWENLTGAAALAAAIARPEIFDDMVEQKCLLQERFIYPDHHVWLQKDLDEIRIGMRRKSIKQLFITEKDAVKIRHLNTSKIKIWVVPLTIELTPHVDEFYATLTQGIVT